MKPLFYFDTDFPESNTKLYIAARPLEIEMTEDLWKSLSNEDREIYYQLRTPQRKVEWCESRRSLQYLKKGNGLLQEKTYHLSISHTTFKNLGVAVSAITNQNEPNSSIRGIGIDIEHQERGLSDILTRRLILKDEIHFNLDSLWIWMIKESCFKADGQQPYNHKITDYQINTFDQVNQTGTVISPINHQKILYQLHQKDPWRIASACATNTLNS